MPGAPPPAHPHELPLPTVQTRTKRISARIASAVVCLAVAAPALSSCGGDALGVATTVVGVTPTAFATIPPVASTLPGTTTTLPANAVGSETTYTVQPGDSPISVATKYGITVSLLLSYNALLTVNEFPFPGQVLKIPASATITQNTPAPATGNSTAPATGNSTAPAVAAGAGCGTRPAGTYKIQAGDSMWSIKKKFCVTAEQIAAANQWPSTGVTLLPGQTINIPAANG